VRVAICVERSPGDDRRLDGHFESGRRIWYRWNRRIPSEAHVFQYSKFAGLSVLTQEHLTHSLPVANVQTICLDRDWREISLRERPRIQRKAPPHPTLLINLHLRFDGTAKGVSARSWVSVNRFFLDVEAVSVCHLGKLVVKAALSFVRLDLGDIWTTTPGRTVGDHPDDTVKDPQRFRRRRYRSTKVTRLVLVPSLLRVNP